MLMERVVLYIYLRILNLTSIIMTDANISSVRNAALDANLLSQCG